MLHTRPFVLGIVLVLGLTAPVGSVSAQTSRTVTRTASLDRDGQVALETFTGSIDVTGWMQDRVEMKARIEGDDPELVEKTRLTFDADERRVSVEVDYDEVKDSQKFLGLFNIGDVDRPEVHLEIKMPRAAALEIDDFSSEIRVTGLRAGVTLDTFSSTITLDDIEGTTDLETFSGEVEGTRLRGAVRLDAFSGDARFRMDALTGESRFETFSGDVDLYLPADADFEVVAEEDIFGDLDSEFELRADEGRRIVGNGSARIALESFSGDFHLRRR